VPDVLVITTTATTTLALYKLLTYWLTVCHSVVICERPCWRFNFKKTSYSVVILQEQDTEDGWTAEGIKPKAISVFASERSISPAETDESWWRSWTHQVAYFTTTAAAAAAAAASTATTIYILKRSVSLCLHSADKNVNPWVLLVRWWYRHTACNKSCSSSSQKFVFGDMT